MRALILSLALGFCAAAHAAKLDVEVEGVSGDLADAVRATLGVAQYEEREISAPELRASFDKAEAEIRAALEPFGYYDPRIEANLSGDEQSGFRAHFEVTPGEPVVVRGVNVQVRGEGEANRRVREALEAFAPKVGHQLHHGVYESSKGAIDSALRGSGFLKARTTQRRVTVRPENQSAEVDLVWESGERFRFGEVRFSGDAPFPESMLQKYVPWREDAFYSSEQVLNLQQRLVDADYFELVSVQPNLDEAEGDRVPIDVLLDRDERTVYTGEVYYSTDFGPGVRVGAERRWLNRKGHKAGVDLEYSQRLQEIATHYKIPRPGRQDKSYDFGVAYRDEQTDIARSRNFQFAASESRTRWNGFTRTLGLKYLRGDFEIGQEDENIERGESSLTFAEGTLGRRRLDDRLAPRRGYVFDFGLRLASDAVFSDTDLAQTWARGTYLIPQGDRHRFKLRGELGAMAVGDFNALPPELRFFAGGDRSVRGFDYHEIGEPNAQGTIVGGKYLAVASAEYEYYFNDDWGAAVFTDAGDAFSSTFNVNVSVGVGVRWRSPLGPVRLDFGYPVKTDLEKSLRVHLLLGPDI